MRKICLWFFNPVNRSLKATTEVFILTETSLRKRIRNHPLFQSFILYSAFRAVYGIGILLVAYFFATSTDTPWWTTLLIFLASMIFSRILFRFIKKFTGKEEKNPLP